MKKLIGLLALIALVSGFGPVCAQGIIAPGHVMGNGTASVRTATDTPLSSILDQNFSGIGLMSRTGTGAYSILSGATAGRLLVDQGSGPLPAFVVLSGDGTLAANGTFALAASGVTAGTYGDGTHSTQVTFDAKGRATSAASVTITHAANDLALSGGAMSGDIAMGGNNVTGMGTLGSQWINGIVYADQMPAADMGAKINAALSLLPSSGGIVDARGLTGNQTLSTAITCTNAEILFGQATIAQSATITEGQDCALVGLPGGIGQGNNFGLTRFVEANGANLPELVLISGGQATLRDIVLDGNKANQTSAGPNLVITGSHYYLANLTLQNSFSHSYELQSSGTSNTACCGTVHNVMSIANDGDGLYCTGVADTMIDLSSFENNAGSAGVELNNCPNTRLSNYDIGGNQIGVWVHGSPFSSGVSLGSGGQIIGLGQFGNNAQQDIFIDDSTGGSEKNQIVGAQFFGSDLRTSNTYAAIDINEGTGGGSNIISGIGVQSPSGNTLTSAVYIHGASTGIDTVGPVVASGTFGGEPFNVPAATALLSACYNGTCTSQGQTLVKPVFTGNGSGYSATAKTAGANGSDQYALALNNPSTAAYATVLGDFFAGGVNLAEIAAQRSNTSSGGSLYLYTYTTAGIKTQAMQIDPNQVVGLAHPLPVASGGTGTTGGFTVSTLPTGVTGERAYVTDATSCTFLGTLVGGGSTFCPVIYNGSAWVGG